MNKRVLYIIIIIAISLASIVGCAAHHDQTHAVNQPTPRPDVIGFDNVLNGREGEEAVVGGFIDAKFVCRDVNDKQRDVCTVAVVGNSSEHKSILIKLGICSDNVTKNCIAELMPGQDPRRRWVFVVNDSSEPIDFDGCRVFEEPNSWICDSTKQLRFTGKITVTDGRGDLLEPIKKIHLLEPK